MRPHAADKDRISNRLIRRWLAKVNKPRDKKKEPRGYHTI
jgi:hypothetical protein